jgi:hypothetical protein
VPLLGQTRFWVIEGGTLYIKDLNNDNLDYSCILYFCSFLFCCFDKSFRSFTLATELK